MTSPSAPGEEPHEEDSPLDATVTHWRQFKLSSFQIRSVAAIRAGHNVLVAAPTGAGKTLVAEYAIEDAAKQGKRCIYTSPIKALSNQKYRDFRDDPDVDVGIMTGDVTINPAGQVLVMTTEILRNAIFESPGLLNDVEFVIFDEIHYMDDRERGTVWEESLIFLPESVRLICLSATISNVDEMGAWLEEIRIQKMEIVRSNKRPVPLSHWGFTKRSGAFDASKQESILKMEQRAGGGNRPRRSSRGRGRGRGGRGDDAADPGKLFDMLEERSLLPALVFSFSRKDCERLARRGMARNLLNEEEQKRVHALARELITVFKLDEGELKGEIFNMAFQGVAYHHAGMLPIHKEIVERLFTAGLIRLLFTTETFALGINMPARSVVFNALRKYDGVSFDWLRVRDYMQMAGRAGRQGIDDKGYVYSMLDGRALEEAPLKKLIAGKPEPVTSRFRLAYSTILHLVSGMGRERLHVAWEHSFSQFQGREKNQKARERQRRKQTRILNAHLAMLEELGYLKGDELTGRGRIARLQSGYELQVTELLFQGTLENLSARELAIIFVALIYEERRRFDRPYIPPKMYGDLRHQVDRTIGDLCSLEVRLGIEPPMKRPDWGLTPATLAWFEGASMQDLEENGANPGDMCRVFRMSIQLMRNVRRAIDRDWDLGPNLSEAMEAINRDEVDARRQLELG